MLATHRTLPLLTLLALTCGPAALAAQERVDTLRATLDGEPVVGGGDEDGSGTATFRFEPEADRLCYDLQVTGIAEATATHVHQGAAGRDGPPVITLSAPRSGSASDCMGLDGGLLDRILANPAGFYVNVHNPDHPAGALRGQLGPVGRP